MRPQGFVSVDEFPRLASGKIDRRALQRRTGEARVEDAVEVDLPRSPLEELLLDVWREALDRRELGVQENFFQAGGHSLRAMQIVVRLRSILGREVPLRLLFDHPTIAGMAESVEVLLREGEEDVDEDDSPIATTDEAPLSFAQRRLWFIYCFDRDSTAYNSPRFWTLEGPLDVAALRAALGAVVERHAVLRTVFEKSGRRDDEDVRLREEAPAGPPTCLVDLRRLGERAEDAARDLAGREALRPFVLESETPLRVLCLRTGEERHHLLYVLHHIATDGWSQSVFARELATFYAAAHAGRPSPLAPLRATYADHARRQQALIASGRMAEHERYWRRRLTGVETLDMPADRPRPERPTHRGGTLRVEISPGLYDRLRNLGHAHRASTFMASLALFDLLLHRLSGQTDLAVGTPIANRRSRSAEALIGFFVNSLVLRQQIDPASSFSDLLADVRATTLDAYAHQDMPFDLLVERLAPERRTNVHPLYQTTFAFQNTPDDGLRLDGLDVRREELGVMSSRFDLEAYLWERDGAPHLALVYSADLYDASTVRRFGDGFVQLLLQTIDSPKAAVRDFSLLSSAQKHQMLVEWNDTQCDYPSEDLLRAIAETARRRPDAIAVDGGAAALTYGGLMRRCAVQVERLIERGVGIEDRCALLMEPSPDWVATMLAIWRVGAVYVPLDPRQPPERMRFLLEDSAPKFLFTTDEMRRRFPEAAAWSGDGATELPSRIPPEIPTTAGAFMIYTSGSTGLPKGVLVSRAGLWNRLIWSQEALPLRPVDAVLQISAPQFDYSVWEMLGPLLVGARTVLIDSEQRLDLRRVRRAVLDRRISVMHFIPSLIQPLLETGDFRGHRLRLALCGGEAVFPAQIEQLFEHFGSPGESGDVEIYNQYGPTESVIDVTYQRFRRGLLSATIGRPIGNGEVRILDRRLRSVPIGVGGELVIGGASTARGYFRRPARTAGSFVPDPLSGSASGDLGRRMYRSGDLARRRVDGEIEFLGRIDRQVKVRGFRIELGEIESVLGEHPQVEDCALVARSGVDGGRVDQLVALVAFKDLPGWIAEHRERLEAERVQSWHEVDEAIYAQGDKPEDDRADFVGWLSSFTGEQIPAHEMRDWVDETMERIREADASTSVELGRVLEIGCGSGLLLFRMADECEAYFGVDFAQPAIRALRERLAQDDGLDHVRVHACAAHEIDAAASEQEAGPFDLVVINSVAQYFPSAEYLADVLDRAVESAVPGARIFIGDVRNLRLQDAFCLSVELARATPTTSLKEIEESARRRGFEEEELVLDPGFFTAWARRRRRAVAVGVRPKTGRARNEMNLFRYDVVVQLDEVVPEARCDVVAPEARIEWRELGGPQGLIRRLGDGEEIVVTSIPDARLSREFAAVEGLAEASGQGASLNDFRERLNAASVRGVDPATLASIAADAGYRCESILRDGSPSGATRYDAVLTPSQTSSAPRFLASSEEGDGGVSGSLGNPFDVSLSNHPLRGAAVDFLLGDLARSAERSLREYMMPNHWTATDALPRLPSGKLDRGALDRRARRLVEQRSSQDYEAPRGLIEQDLAEIWQDLLQIPKVGAEDDFFRLGGHSLLTVRLTARIEQHFEVHVPLTLIFQNPTVRALARRVEQRKRGEPGMRRRGDTLIRLSEKSQARETLFLIHPIGGSAAPYRALARRLEAARDDLVIYGVQARAWDDLAEAAQSLENVAADYLEEIRTIQANGPYLLGGWSMGGVIAFEMCRRLRVAGEDVASLWMIDAIAPRPDAPPPTSNEDAGLRAFLADLGLEFEAVPRGISFPELLDEARRRGLLDDGSEPQWLRRSYEQFLHHRGLLKNYAPAPCDANVLLVQRAEKEERRDPTCGWGEHVEEIRTLGVSGTHYTMVEEPHVEEVARALLSED